MDTKKYSKRLTLFQSILCLVASFSLRAEAAPPEPTAAPNTTLAVLNADPNLQIDLDTLFWKLQEALVKDDATTLGNSFNAISGLERRVQDQRARVKKYFSSPEPTVEDRTVPMLDAQILGNYFETVQYVIQLKLTAFNTSQLAMIEPYAIEVPFSKFAKIPASAQILESSTHDQIYGLVFKLTQKPGIGEVVRISNNPLLLTNFEKARFWNAPSDAKLLSIVQLLTAHQLYKSHQTLIKIGLPSSAVSADNWDFSKVLPRSLTEHLPTASLQKELAESNANINAEPALRLGLALGVILAPELPTVIRLTDVSRELTNLMVDRKVNPALAQTLESKIREIIDRQLNDDKIGIFQNINPQNASEHPFVKAVTELPISMAGMSAQTQWRLMQDSLINLIGVKTKVALMQALTDKTTGKNVLFGSSPEKFDRFCAIIENFKNEIRESFNEPHFVEYLVDEIKVGTEPLAKVESPDKALERIASELVPMATQIATQTAQRYNSDVLDPFTLFATRGRLIQKTVAESQNSPQFSSWISDFISAPNYLAATQAYADVLKRLTQNADIVRNGRVKPALVYEAIERFQDGSADGILQVPFGPTAPAELAQKVNNEIIKQYKTDLKSVLAVGEIMGFHQPYTKPFADLKLSDIVTNPEERQRYFSQIKDSALGRVPLLAIKLPSTGKFLYQALADMNPNLELSPAVIHRAKLLIVEALPVIEHNLADQMSKIQNAKSIEELRPILEGGLLSEKVLSDFAPFEPTLRHAKDNFLTPSIEELLHGRYVEPYLLAGLPLMALELGGKVFKPLGLVSKALMTRFGPEMTVFLTGLLPVGIWDSIHGVHTTVAAVKLANKYHEFCIPTLSTNWVSTGECEEADARASQSKIDLIGRAVMEVPLFYFPMGRELYKAVASKISARLLSGRMTTAIQALDGFHILGVNPGDWASLENAAARRIQALHDATPASDQAGKMVAIPFDEAPQGIILVERKTLEALLQKAEQNLIKLSKQKKARQLIETFSHSDNLVELIQSGKIGGATSK